MIRTLIRFTLLFYAARWLDRTLASTQASPRRLLSGPPGARSATAAAANTPQAGRDI